MLTVRLPRRPRALSRARSLAISVSRNSFFASIEKNLASRSQPDVSLVPIEKHRIEFLLELFYAPADMRLRDAEMLGGVAKMQML